MARSALPQNYTTRVIMWPCGAPYAKIVATEDADGTTCTVEAVPFNR